MGVGGRGGEGFGNRELELEPKINEKGKEKTTPCDGGGVQPCRAPTKFAAHNEERAHMGRWGAGHEEEDRPWGDAANQEAQGHGNDSERTGIGGQSNHDCKEVGQP